MAFGLSLTGFVVKTLTDLKTSLEGSWRSAFNANIPLGTRSVWGRIIGIMSERFAELWEQLQALYSATDPNNAQGLSLEVLCALTGTYRLKALRSLGLYTATGVPGTTLAQYRVITVTGTGVRFQTKLDATIATVATWAAATFVAGALVTRGGNIYQCVSPGTSVTGPTGTGSVFADGGTARWSYVGAGTGAIEIVVESQDTGPFVAIAGSLVTIATAVSGWTGGRNMNDVTPGRLVESDPDLRLRRVAELTSEGAGTPDAIRARLLKIPLVTDVAVLSNTTDATDSDGLPPHSIMALVSGGSAADSDGDGHSDGDELIANTLWKVTGGGIATYGSSQLDVLDSEGNTQTVHWQVPTAVPIYLAITVEVDATKFPADGVAQIMALIVAYGNSMGRGRDARYRALMAQAYGVAGVLNSDGYISTTAFPLFQADVVISRLQRATFDNSRILSVTVNPVTP